MHQPLLNTTRSYSHLIVFVILTAYFSGCIGFRVDENSSPHPGPEIHTNSCVAPNVVSDTTQNSDWVCVFAEPTSAYDSLRISYVEKANNNCHACTTEVWAELFKLSTGEKVNTIFLDVPSNWGAVSETFRVHEYEHERLLSYAFHSQAQGNSAALISFFDLQNLSSTPIATYFYHTGSDLGMDWSDVPELVKREYTACTPYEIDESEYIYVSGSYKPEFDISDDGNVILKYTHSTLSFEPLSPKTCRGFMTYTLPDRTIVLGGPLQPNAGENLSVSFGPKYTTGYDLGQEEGLPNYSVMPRLY